MRSAGRRYLPADAMVRFGVDEGQIEGRVFTPEFRAMVQSLVMRTREMLLEGGEISKYVDRELAVVLDLFRKGGEAILNGIASQDYDVLRGRPVVSKTKKLGLLMEAFFGKLRAGTARDDCRGLCRLPSRLHNERRRTSITPFACCRSISGMRCARCMRSCGGRMISRTMRSLPVAERRDVMARWLDAWRDARRSDVSDDPVFVALNDTQRRFAIPDALLEDLVRGTTMDLEPRDQWRERSADLRDLR